MRSYRILSLTIAFILFLTQTGTDSPESHLTICLLQGREDKARYEGLPVKTEGVVTLDLDETGAEGFFMQSEGCDDDPLTSDGIFVYLGERVDLVSPGDRVEVRGWVNEYQGLTEIGAGPHNVKVIGVSPLPAPVVFDPPWDEGDAARYFEAHESMRIAMNDSLVVGPATSRGEVYVVVESHRTGRVLHGMASGAIVRLSSGGLFDLPKTSTVGDRLSGMEGILSVEQQAFAFLLTAPPALSPGALEFDGLPQPADDFSFASLNLHNLFDAIDDPATQDQVPSSAAYRRKLEKLARAISGDLHLPLFIAVQEAENDDVLQALANRPELTARYDFVWADGPDTRGIDVALLYRTDRVEINSWEVRQGCTRLVDGLGPDGNLDVGKPQNARTCETDVGSGLDGNRLFSRPPLVVRLAVCAVACAPGVERTHYTVISFHLKSKSQDTPMVAYTEPRRVEQADFLAGIYREISVADPEARVIVAGDFNDYPDSAAAGRLVSAGLVPLVTGDRYTYNFRGVSQAIDQVFVSPALFRGSGIFPAAFPRHIASDYPVFWESDSSVSLRASDHDPVLVLPVRSIRTLHFPLVFHP